MNDIDDLQVLDFIMRMKRRARRKYSGKAQRVSYTQGDRTSAIQLLAAIEARGGTLRDAAEIMSVNEATLLNWLDRFTSPDTDWQMRAFATDLKNVLMGLA